MKIVLGSSFSREFEIIEQITIINEIESNLNDYFSNQNYGDNIEQVYIGIICVSKDFEQFFPLSDKIKINRKPPEIEYGVKLDFNYYKALSYDDKKAHIYSEILKRSEIMLVTRRVNDFDRERFLTDLRGCVLG